MRKTNEEMRLEGLKTKPSPVFSNSLDTQDLTFWHKNPIEYELVYRGSQYLYVPKNDTKSSENNGGNWTFAFEGLSLEPYGDNISFAFTSEKDALKVQNIFETIIKNNLIPKNSSYIETRVLQAFVKYCQDNSISLPDLLPNYKEVCKEWMFKRSNFNKILKPYWEYDKQYNLLSTTNIQLKLRHLARLQKKYDILNNKMQKINEQMKEIENSIKGIGC